MHVTLDNNWLKGYSTENNAVSMVTNLFLGPSKLDVWFICNQF